MSERKERFDRLTAGAEPVLDVSSGIWDLPAEMIDAVSGADSFTQGNTFIQNFACFCQSCGCFSQGSPPPRPL